jgi:hypothetical protein
MGTCGAWPFDFARFCIYTCQFDHVFLLEVNDELLWIFFQYGTGNERIGIVDVCLYLSCHLHHLEEGLLLVLDVVGHAEPSNAFQDLL